MGEDEEYKRAIQSAIDFASDQEPYLGGNSDLRGSQHHENWAANLQLQYHGPERGSEKK